MVYHTIQQHRPRILGEEHAEKRKVGLKVSWQVINVQHCPEIRDSVGRLGTERIKHGMVSYALHIGMKNNTFDK